MPRVRVKCPECRIILRVRSEESLAKRLRCPRCGLGFDPEPIPDRSVLSLDDFSTQEERPPQKERPPQTPHFDTESPPAQSEHSLAESHSDRSDTRPSEPRNRSRRHRSGARASRSGRSSRSSRERRSKDDDSADTRSGRSLFYLGAMALIAITIAATWWFGLLAGAGMPATADNAADTVTAASVEKAVAASAPIESSDSSATFVNHSSIRMDYIPIVPQVLFHLRPNEFWSSAGDRRELLASLGDLGRWFDNMVYDFTGFRPEEMQELTLAVNFGSRTSEPDITAVVRLVQPAAGVEQLIERIQGQPLNGLNADVYEAGGRAFLFPDAGTIVVAGRDLAEDLADSRTIPAVPTIEMETLLRRSERTRHATLLFDLQQLDVHRRTVLIEQLQSLADEVVLWFGSPARMVALSVQLTPHLTILTDVTHTAESSTRHLNRHLQSQLEKLPVRLTDRVRSLHPATRGRRRLVARFPAMMEAARLGTETETFAAGVRLRTLLPKKAAANLAAAATITWDETVRPVRRMPPVAISPDRSEKTVAEKLRALVEAEFRREPLEDAVKFIASEVEVTLRIDGDALQRSGFTRNMPQTHNLGSVPAVQALDAILNQYDGQMVIVLEEDTGTIVLTTRSVAEESGLTVFDTSP